MRNRKRYSFPGEIALSVILWGLVIVPSVSPARAATLDYLFSKIADTRTSLPGGAGNFTSLGSASIFGQNVVFGGGGSSSQGGIYIHTGGSLNTVADHSTAIPGGIGNFSGLGSASISGGNVVFYGSGSSGQQGIYSSVGNSLSTVADRSTAIPGGIGSFTSFENPSISGGNVAFTGSGMDAAAPASRSVPTNIYISRNGLLYEIIASNDTLEGKIIQSLEFGDQGLSGDSVVIQTLFMDGSQAIYRADVV